MFNSRSTPTPVTDGPAEAPSQPQTPLREAQARLEAALAAGEIGTWTIDVASKRVTGDPHIARLFAVDPENTVSGNIPVDSFLNAIHEGDRVRVIRNLADAMSGDGDEYEDDYRVVHPAGSHRWLSSRGKIQRDAAGNPVSLFGAVVDITGRKEAAESLARSEARFRAQADAMPQMVWATDADGNHLYYNRRWYEYTGQTVEESMGFGFALALHPDDQERTLERWRRAWEGGEDYEIEYRFRRHDGAYRWFVGRAEPVRHSETGTVTMWAGTCTDIDDFKRTQDELRVSEERFRSLVEATAQIIWNTRKEGEFVSEQPPWAVYTGQTWDEYRGTGWLNAVHSEDREKTFRVWSESLKRRTLYQVEHRLRRRDGVYRHFAVRAAPVLAADGSVREWIGTHNDVTERVETEGRERFLTDLTVRMRALLDPEEVLYQTAKAVGEYTAAHRCLYIEVNEDDDTLTIRRDFVQGEGVGSIAGTFPLAAFGPPIIESLRAGNVTQSTDTEADPRLLPEHRATFRATNFRAFLGIPLHRAGRMVAILAVHYAQPRVWTTEEAELLTAVAERTWLAVENARLYRAQQELAARNERIAETLQRSMLVAPPTDSFAGIEIATRYEAAWDEAQVGGDFHDTFALTGGRVAFVVGDATGKGLEAAAHTAEVKYVLRAYLRESPDPALALERLNRFLTDGQRFDGKGLDEPSFVAVTVAVLHPETGAAECAGAGAEPPLLVRAATVTVEEIDARGTLIGADGNATYRAAPFTLEAGDLLLMTTDGITEARNPADRRRFFADHGLTEAARDMAREAIPVDESARNIAARAKAFAGGKLHDDVCVLLIRRNAPQDRAIEAGKL